MPLKCPDCVAFFVSVPQLRSHLACDHDYPAEKSRIVADKVFERTQQLDREARARLRGAREEQREALHAVDQYYNALR